MKNKNFILKFVIAITITFGFSAYANAQNPFNYCLDFDGTDDYVQIADNNSLDVTTNYTIEVWIKPESFSWLGGIVTKYHVGGSN
ncbi:MAG: LamG domain-containing protein, partial [Bacteroidales bacterium]|nr:LamG domain-containing protein [Bacteroidales bacterium]